MKNKKKALSKRFIVMYIISTVIRVSGLSADGHCPAMRADNFSAIKKMVLRGQTIKEFGNKSRIRCAMLCVDNVKCRSFNHDKTNGICQLNDGRHDEFPEDLQADDNWSYYHNVPEKFTENSESVLCWPSGTYGLPMPSSGCPTDDGFNWETGYRGHDTDDVDPHNSWSARLHFWGAHGTNNMNQHFCMKTVDRVGHCNPEWPQGEYCVFKYGNNCPKNMASGSIYWDDEDNGNHNSISGTVPSGHYNNHMSYHYSGFDTRIYYCCMIIGSASQPIALPTGSPFYLFPYTAECQQVKGMTVMKEWFLWDSDGSRPAPGGTHPHYQASGIDHFIYYCYYEPLPKATC